METNTFFLMWAGAIVFLMQAGFATLSAGSIRQKNVKNILCARAARTQVSPHKGTLTQAMRPAWRGARVRAAG